MVIVSTLNNREDKVTMTNDQHMKQGGYAEHVEGTECEPLELFQKIRNFFKLHTAWYGTFQYNDVQLLNAYLRQEEFFSQNS